ncbi:MAG: zeta toxin family protein [Chitinophagaceae bacterium]
MFTTYLLRQAAYNNENKLLSTPIFFRCTFEYSMANLYMIAGCNGAGKTTASDTILPDILDCREFVNADNIARGLSPYNVESVAFEAGRIMLHRIEELLMEGVDFAIETTLSTRSYVSLVQRAQDKGYQVTLIYVWLESPDLAIERVAQRVAKGGHHIPSDIVRRRYVRGLHNLIHLYIPIVDLWSITNNTANEMETIATGQNFIAHTINNQYFWNQIQLIANGNEANY